MIGLPLQALAQVPVERTLNALPEGILVAFFAWVLLRVLRRQNSGTRFAVWFLALLMVAALPLLEGFGAGRVRMLTGMAPGMSAPASSSLGSMRPAIAIPGGWALFIFLAWVLGAGASMARLAAGLWRLRQLRRTCTPLVAADLDPALQDTVDTIARSGAVTIATSESVRVPAAIGFWKRTIVLPAWALGELPANDLRAILLHEFAHLRRWDDWTNLIQKMVRALFFFHPAVWWIESRLTVEREMACDDAVLAETANPHGYASCLVSLLEKSMAHRLSQRGVNQHWSMAHAAVHRVREASMRLARILDGRRCTATRVWKPALGMMGIFSLLCLAVLPQAPQLVAFETARVGTGTGVGTGAPSASTGQALARPSRAQLGSGPQPEQLRVRDSDPSSARVTAKMTTAKVAPARAVAGRQPVPGPVVAAQSVAQSAGGFSDGVNQAPPLNQAVAINTTVNQEMVPRFETLVFFEATQYGASLWRIQVWRVTLLVPGSDRSARVPVVNSI